MNAPTRRVSIKTLIVAFTLLVVLFSGMVFAALHHGTPVRFGLTPGAHAFGAARLLRSASPQYAAMLYDQEETVLRALDNHVIDAALVSVENAVRLDENVYEIRGVFSVTELLVLSAESTVLNMQSLSGRTLLLPKALEGSAEDRLLQKLLRDADTAGIELIYTENIAQAYAQHAGAVVLVTPDDMQLTVLSVPALSARFRLSSEWRAEYLTVPPAGYCIVARRDVIGTGTFASFEKHVRDSMIYADRKRKKTIAMAVEAGIFSHEAQADQLIDHMSFTYHEGQDALSAIDAWKNL